MIKVELHKALNGRILDIGGGGEGVIGQIYGQQVTAIDNRQDELDEAPEGFKKLLMDATSLNFSKETFDNITFFYSFMYMDKETQAKAILEASRVLQYEGSICIWDAVIVTAYPEPFITELDINANGKHIKTAYGIIKDDAKQNSATFIALCEKVGLRLIEQHEYENQFYLRFIKDDL